MMACRGSSVIASLLLPWAQDESVDSFTVRPLYSQEKNTQYPMSRTLCGPQTLSERLWRRKNSYACRELNLTYSNCNIGWVTLVFHKHQHVGLHVTLVVVVVVFVVIFVKKPATENRQQFLSLDNHITFSYFSQWNIFPVQAVKEHRRIGGIAPLFLKLGTRWKLVVNFTPWPLLPRGENTGILWGGWLGSQRRSGRFGEGKNFLDFLILSYYMWRSRAR
jgi:hypothetical protein